MATETKLNLAPETMDLLRELIVVNHDSRDGFRHAASQIEQVNVANLFMQLADERDHQARELMTMLNLNQQDPPQEGSMMAAAHRTWMDLRTALGGGLQAVLDEAERGEDQIKAKYEEAMKANPASPVSDVLHRQYASVKAAHDRVRDLRDAHRQEKTEG